ncbi:MAG: DUF3795 domain-containing protein [Promethearchaeota archaeon]
MEGKFVSYCGKYLCSLCGYHRGAFTEPAKHLYNLAKSYKSLRLIAGVNKTFDFDEFMKGLEWLASQEEPCKGCRMGGGWSWWSDCPVRTCCMEKEIEFCYQCSEFPCKTLKKGPLKDRKQQVIEANLQLKKVGIKSWIQHLKKKYLEK